MGLSKEERKVSIEAFKAVINQSESIRSLAKLIGEDSSDISRWRNGFAKISVRAVVSICRLFDVRANTLRPDIFQSDVELVFKRKDG